MQEVESTKSRFLYICGLIFRWSQRLIGTLPADADFKKGRSKAVAKVIAGLESLRNDEKNSIFPSRVKQDDDFPLTEANGRRSTSMLLRSVFTPSRVRDHRFSPYPRIQSRSTIV